MSRDFRDHTGGCRRIEERWKTQGMRRPDPAAQENRPGSGQMAPSRRSLRRGVEGPRQAGERLVATERDRQATPAERNAMPAIGGGHDPPPKADPEADRGPAGAR